MGFGSAVPGSRISFEFGILVLGCVFVGFSFFLSTLGARPAPSLQPVPGVILVQRLFQGILSY